MICMFVVVAMYPLVVGCDTHNQLEMISDVHIHFARFVLGAYVNILLVSQSEDFLIIVIGPSSFVDC